MIIPVWAAVFMAVIGVPALTFAGQTWIKGFIERRLQLGMESQLEAIRGEIRQSEERLKSELRTREAEIASLREAALTGRAGRMALVDKRRLEAVERMWGAVTKLTGMKGPAMSLSMLKFDAVAERVPNDPKLRELLSTMIETLGGKSFEERMTDLGAANERPFLSDLAWALYSAYSAIILGGWATMKVLSIGADDAEKLINRKHINDLLKTVLPHLSAYIDEHGAQSHYHLLEELEKNILAELRRSLDGSEADEENLKRSSDIMKQVAKVTSDTEKLVIST